MGKGMVNDQTIIMKLNSPVGSYYNNGNKLKPEFTAKVYYDVHLNFEQVPDLSETNITPSANWQHGHFRETICYGETNYICGSLGPSRIRPTLIRVTVFVGPTKRSFVASFG